MAGNSKHFIYDMANFESSRGRTPKFSNFFGFIEFNAYRRAYSNHCGSVQNCKARLVYMTLHRMYNTANTDCYFSHCTYYITIHI